MVSLAILKKRGITPETLRKKLEVDFSAEGNEKLRDLRNRIRTRLQNGRDDNLENCKLYYALDKAWDAPFQQITPTLVQSLIDQDPSSEAVRDAVSKWGLENNEAFTSWTAPDVKSGKNTDRSVRNIPTFIKIIVPLCRAYVTTRLAKIMNDRRLVPFFKYEPAFSNIVSRLRCEVITSRVEMISRQFGYWDVVKQNVYAMLQYGASLQFPMEAWYRERQEVSEGSSSNDDFDKGIGGVGAGLTGEKKKPKSQITKEGIRYHMPHPSRTFFDKAYRASTFNTDTGCQYAGYWRVIRWGEVQNNPLYFNKEKVTIGPTEWWSNASVFFNTVYASCNISTPVDWTTGWNDSLDRETQIADRFYVSGPEDRPVVLSEYFEKLIPSENGLGDYEFPVWFRFVVAASDTIVYAEPFPYSPIVYYGYDCDENRDPNASLTLEILPWQDQFSNVLSQYIYTAKQNLANVTFVDEEIVSDKWIAKLENMGEKLWSGMNFLGFKGRKVFKAQQDVTHAFHSHNFPKQDTNSLLIALKTILDTLERVLAFSSQEIGQAASHELRAEEVRNIAQATSTRAKFTSIPVDNAQEATKRQLYEALMQYGSEEFFAEVPMDQDVSPELLSKLGFTYDKESAPSPKTDKKITVKATKTAIMYETFTNSRDGDDRTNNGQLATAMLQALAPMLSNPLILQKLGNQFIPLMNEIFRMAGFPRDFTIQDQGDQGMPPEMIQQVQQMLGQFQEQMTQEVQQGMEPVIQAVKVQGEKQNEITEQVKTVAVKTLQIEQVLEQFNKIIAQAQTFEQNEPIPGQPNQAALVA